MRKCVWCCLMSLGMIAGCSEAKRPPDVVFFETETKSDEEIAAELAAAGSQASGSTAAENAVSADEPKQPPKPLLSASGLIKAQRPIDAASLRDENVDLKKLAASLDGKEQ